jgi:hypothetical protein
MDETFIKLPFRGVPYKAILAVSDEQLQLLLNGDVITYPANTEEYDQTGEEMQRAVWYCGRYWRVVTLIGLTGARLYNDVPRLYSELHGYMPIQEAFKMANQLAIDFGVELRSAILSGKDVEDDAPDTDYIFYDMLQDNTIKYQYGQQKEQTSPTAESPAQPG